MLSAIKAMIAKKEAFQESVSIIVEDANSAQNLDDLIVLGEDSDIELPGEDDSDDEDPGINDNTGDNEPKEDDEDDEEDNNEDDDLMNDQTNQDDIPTPIGRQTSEPVIDDIDDLMKVEIDLKSNTSSDILPVPPSNAGEAIADDIMNHRVDSGFENDGDSEPETAVEDNSTDSSIMDENIDDIDNSNTMTEAITLDGGDNSNGDPAPDNNEPKEDDTQETVEDPGPDEEENSVTSAVRDKVAEAEEDFQPSKNAGKEELLKKLGNITKNLEDAKKAIMDSLG